METHYVGAEVRVGKEEEEAGLMKQEMPKHLEEKAVEAVE